MSFKEWFLANGLLANRYSSCNSNCQWWDWEDFPIKRTGQEKGRSFKAQWSRRMLTETWVTEVYSLIKGNRGYSSRDSRGWDGWMASLTPWTWVWVGSGSWCRTGRPGVLQLMGSQRVGTTERLNRTELFWESKKSLFLPTRQHYTWNINISAICPFPFSPLPPSIEWWE